MASNAKVLLVDDEAVFLTSTAKLLSNRGYRVQTALNGESALQILTENDIDVVIMDIRMPKMDGLTALKQMKTRFSMVEVVLLSGQTTFEKAIEGLKEGAADYLMKPCQLDDLIRKIEEAYEKRQINKEKLHYQETVDKKNR